MVVKSKRYLLEQNDPFISMSVSVKRGRLSTTDLAKLSPRVRQPSFVEKKYA